jgi:hypothetical protein
MISRFRINSFPVDGKRSRLRAVKIRGLFISCQRIPLYRPRLSDSIMSSSPRDAGNAPANRAAHAVRWP